MKHIKFPKSVITVLGIVQALALLNAQALSLRTAWEADPEEALPGLVEQTAAKFPQCASAAGDDADINAGLVGMAKMFIAWTSSTGGGLCVFNASGALIFRRSGPVEDALARDENGDGIIEFAVRFQGRGTGVSNVERQIYFVRSNQFGTPNTYDEGGYQTTFEPISNPTKGKEDYQPEILTYELTLEFFDQDGDGFRESAILRRTEWWGADDDLLTNDGLEAWVPAALKRRYGVAPGEKRSRVVERWTWSPKTNRYDQVRVR